MTAWLADQPANRAASTASSSVSRAPRGSYGASARAAASRIDDASPACPRAQRIVPCSRLACARASGSPSFGVAASSSTPARTGWPAISAASDAASSRPARRPSSADSSAARDRNITVAAYPPRSRARPAACSSRAATASSGPAAAIPRCHATRSGSLPSPAAASAR